MKLHMIATKYRCQRRIKWRNFIWDYARKAKQPIIIASLVVFFPVGLFLMWKFADWSKKTKWKVTYIVAFFIVFGLVGAYYSPPSITVENAKNNKINTDNSTYVLEGDVASMKSATIAINGQELHLTEDAKFSYKATLKEGDNNFILVAINENGKTEKMVTIHRTTRAEFAAIAEAERLAAEKRAEEEKREQDEVNRKNQQDQANTEQQDDSNNNSHVSVEPTPSKPKYSYNEFAIWITSTASKEYYWKYDGIGENDINTYNTVLSYCGVTGDWSDNKWVSCMQEAYSKYLKPETFTSDKNVYDFLDMYGTMFNARFGQANDSDIKAAQTAYERFAVTE